MKNQTGRRTYRVYRNPILGDERSHLQKIILEWLKGMIRPVTHSEYLMQMRSIGVDEKTIHAAIHFLIRGCFVLVAHAATPKEKSNQRILQIRGGIEKRYFLNPWWHCGGTKSWDQFLDEAVENKNEYGHYTDTIRSKPELCVDIASKK